MACVELSRGTAYGVALSQMALTVGAVLFFPVVRVQMFVATPNVVNGTLDSTSSETTKLLMGGPMLLTAGFVVYFSMATMSLQETGGLNSEYSHQGMEQTGLWNFAFWLIFALGHAILVLILTSPCDAYAAGLCVFLLTYFTFSGCSPNPGGYTQTQGNLSILGYAAGAYLVYRNIPGGGSNRSAFLFAFLMLDYIMAVGHAWDRQATLDTITNCRLFYVCACSLGLCVVYGVWWDFLRLPTA